MLASDTRTTEWGATLSALLVRDFIQAWICHDALLDFVNEYVFDGVQSGDCSPAEVAEALRVAIDEILDTAKPEDWEHVARDLIANAQDALTDAANPPADRPTVGADFLPVAQNAKVRQRRQTSERIMAAAEDLPAEPGEKRSLIKIAARAEVSVATIFQRFGDRPGLLAAIRAQRVLRIEQLWAESNPLPGASALGQILAAADAYLQIALGDPEAFRAITAPHEPAAETCRELTDAVARRIADQNKRIAHAIARGIQDGSIRSVDPEQTAALLWAAWNGVIGLGSRPDALRATERDLRRQLAAVTEAILRGPRATEPPEARR